MRCSPQQSAGGERGAVMMFILLFMGIIAIVTSGVMLLIAGDISAGTRQLQAVRVFNIAEAGLHYAMAKLQGTDADAYGGEASPLTMTGGVPATTLGSVTIAVRCLDGTAPPCVGPNAAYRRVVSTGSLTVGGPTRTVVAVVEGVVEGYTGYAICAYDQVIINQGIEVFGDVGSNGNIDLRGPSSSYAKVRREQVTPPAVPRYNGDAKAVGAILCSQGCPTQVEGTTTPGAPGPVCPTVALPAFSPGTQNLDSNTWGAPSYTMDSTTGYNWQDIRVRAAGTGGGCTGNPAFRDLIIQTGAAGTTTVVNIRRLEMERCTRLIIAGDGKVDLRVAELSGQAVFAGQYSRVGVLPADTWLAPSPSPAGRLRVSVQSTSTSPPAVALDRASVVSGAWHVPNGTVDLDQSASGVGDFYGMVLSRVADIDRNYQFRYEDIEGFGTPKYGNFNRLRSWKDQ